MSDKIKCCGLTWEDTTSYRRGEERVPSCWTSKVGVFKVTVLSSHIYYPGEWVARCEPLFDTKPLNVKTRDEAMKKALLLARKPIQEAYEILAAVDAEEST